VKSRLATAAIITVMWIAVLAPGEVITGQDQNLSRTEKCLECARGCLQQPEIRELVIIEKHIGYVIWGASAIFGLLCGCIVIWASSGMKSEQNRILLAGFSSSMSVVIMRMILETVTHPVICDLYCQMHELGCDCAIYCGSFL
jgi:hypothetical protein